MVLRRRPLQAPASVLLCLQSIKTNAWVLLDLSPNRESAMVTSRPGLRCYLASCLRTSAKLAAPSRRSAGFLCHDQNARLMLMNAFRLIGVLLIGLIGSSNPTMAAPVHREHAQSRTAQPPDDQGSETRIAAVVND